MLPVLYEALLSVIVTAAPLARWDKAKYLQRLYINWAWVLSQVKTSLQQIYWIMVEQKLAKIDR